MRNHSFLHRLHGNLQYISGRIEMRGINLLPIQTDFQLTELAQMFHIDKQRLRAPLAPQLILGSPHRTNEGKGIVPFQRHARRPLQTNLVKRHPSPFQDGERDLIATPTQHPRRKRYLQQSLILCPDVARNNPVSSIRQFVIGHGIVYHDLEHRTAPEHTRQVYRKQRRLRLPNCLQREKNVQHLRPAPRCL